MSLFAQGRGAVNEWLDRNPMVLSAGSLFLGLLLIGWGVAGLMSGKARSKWGTQFEGNQANILSIVRLVAGIAVCLFGIYKMVV